MAFPAFHGPVSLCEADEPREPGVWESSELPVVVANYDEYDYEFRFTTSSTLRWCVPHRR